MDECTLLSVKWNCGSVLITCIHLSLTDPDLTFFDSVLILFVCYGLQLLLFYHFGIAVSNSTSFQCVKCYEKLTRLISNKLK